MFFRIPGFLVHARPRSAALRLQLTDLRDGTVTTAPLPLALRDVLAEFVDHRRKFAIVFLFRSVLEICFIVQPLQSPV